MSVSCVHVDYCRVRALGNGVRAVVAVASVMV